MNYFDVIFFLVLLWGFYKGFRKGLIKAFFGFLAVVFGVYFAINFSYKVDILLNEFFVIEKAFSPLLSFIVSFMGVVLALKAIAFVFEKIISLVALGLINRLLGGVFGLLKMGGALGVLVLVLNSADSLFSIIPDKQKKESLLYPHISSVASSLQNRWSNEPLLFDEEEGLFRSVKKFNLY